MTNPPRDDRDLDWLVNSFVERIPGASSAVVVSTDGLVLALSDRIARDTADQLAAATSGLASLTVFLAHGAADTVIPQTETPSLAAYYDRAPGRSGVHLFGRTCPVVSCK